MSSLKFSTREIVSANDSAFTPLVSEDAIGTITKVYPAGPGRRENGYDVLIETAEGTTEEFYYHESELSEVK